MLLQMLACLAAGEEAQSGPALQNMPLPWWSYGVAATVWQLNVVSGKQPCLHHLALVHEKEDFQTTKQEGVPAKRLEPR